jgi:hypothetical protein
MEKEKIILPELKISEYTISNSLPDTISKCVQLMDTPAEKMMAIYSGITIAGALMPHAWFNYDNKRNYPQTMFVIVFPPASGKGKVALFNRLMSKINLEQKAINNKLLADYQAKLKLQQSLLKKGGQMEHPTKPSLKLITLPGNTTSSKLIQQLAENNGEMSALMIETEIDGLTNMMGNQFGSDNSMILRKIFHNETISQMRKNNNEHLEATNPKMAILLTGTPSQISKLFKSNKDGLNTRFGVLTGNTPLCWKDVKPCDSCIPLEEEFDKIGEVFYAVYHKFKKKRIELKFTDEQWSILNETGTKWLEESKSKYGEYATGIAKRHVNMIGRVACTLNMLNVFEKKIETEVILCGDTDFQNALWLMQHSFDSALKLFDLLPGDGKSNERLEEFFIMIPEKFQRKEISFVREHFNISDRSIDRLLEKLVANQKLKSPKRGYYEKNAMSEAQNGETKIINTLN